MHQTTITKEKKIINKADWGKKKKNNFHVEDYGILIAPIWMDKEFDHHAQNLRDLEMNSHVELQENFEGNFVS